VKQTIASSTPMESLTFLWRQPYIHMFQLWSSLVFDFDYEQKYKNIYHNLPQTTTLLISFTTFYPFLEKDNELILLFFLANHYLFKIKSQQKI
jgi:hypothetical protein